MLTSFDKIYTEQVNTKTKAENMSGKQEADKIIDLSDGGVMTAMPDYVLKHMPKKWHSKMCQCCWKAESQVAMCLGCVENLGGDYSSLSSEDEGETEAYSDVEHGMSAEGARAYAAAAIKQEPEDSQMD